MVGGGLQSLDGFHHRELRRLEDVDPVDHFRLHHTDRVGDRAALKLLRDALPLFGGELLRIVQLLGHRSVAIEDARRRDDRARKTATPHLVHTGDKAETVRPCL